MLSVITPAETYDLTTVEAVQAEIGAGDDALLATMVTQASQAIAAYCRRVFPEETVRETLRPNHCLDRLTLSRWPITSVTSITENGAALTASDYEVDQSGGQLIRLCDDSPRDWPSSKIVIVYVGGYAEDAIPDQIQRAAIELVKTWWTARDRDPSIRDVQYSDQSSISYQVNRSSLPLVVTDLVATYRSVGWLV